ncbi:MAG TPA: hypothetical protein VGQ37_10010 [Vicinamibacterales bacterium]|nr:hypothetical protein [Vicinamibacterales bacterium]
MSVSIVLALVGTMFGASVYQRIRIAGTLAAYLCFVKGAGVQPLGDEYEWLSRTGPAG